MRPRELFRDVGLFAVRTPTLPPATHTNAYAIGGEEVLLVEPGTPYEDEQRAMLAWIRELERAGRRVVATVLTHHHPDHVGGAGFLARELGVPIWAHRETAARLPELRVDRMLEDGESLALAGADTDGWRVMHTPGHAPGHVCLHDAARGIAIVGDMVATVGTILIEPNDGDMARYLAELARLASLEARLALPAHGEPIDEPTALFERYIAHRAMREDRVLEAVRASPGAAIEALVAAAYADTPSALWPIAKLSLEAHLVKLANEGRVRRDGGGFVAG